MQRIHIFLNVLMVFSMSVILACSGSSGSKTDSSGGTGTLSLNLVDASIETLKAVYVTIDTVKVHIASTSDDDIDDGNESNELNADVSLKTRHTKKTGSENGDASSGWQIVASPSKKTYNLLELVNGTMEKLGATELSAGHYSQIRLILGDTPDSEKNINDENHPYANYIVTESLAYHELKVPSGYQSGIKLVHGFDLEDGQNLELVLDFDASKSVVQAGKSGTYLLKPTIKIINQEKSGAIQGTISDSGDPPLSLENVSVSAQTSDPADLDALNQVIVNGSTFSDADGAFKLLLESGSYTLVAYKNGYVIFCQNITVESGKTIQQDIALTTDDAGSGTLSGTITMASGNDEDDVALSIRQTAICSENSEMIETASVQISNGGAFSVSLAPGTYEIVASGDGLATKTYPGLTITAGTDAAQDIWFE
ncbi:MAG: DUF4382 domain-containing protein [Proteobacteria bacterium]|nr:DUF4382 domain-containing protein [Pseudomonadota bacterium]